LNDKNTTNVAHVVIEKFVFEMSEYEICLTKWKIDDLETSALYFVLYFHIISTYGDGF
jgi:hypothetical protein